MTKIAYRVKGEGEDYSGRLENVYKAVQSEATLLHPKLQAMISSYANGKAALMIDSNSDKVIGYIRLTELLGSELKAGIGLSPNFPNIEEIGTAIIINEPLYRGKGYYPGLRNKLLTSQLPRLQREELLIIGTTKNPKVITVLDDARALGIDFYIVPHLNLPNLAAFTCTCTPMFGTGMQFDKACEARIAPENAQLIQIARNKGEKKFASEGRIKCTMYVSSIKLARRIDKELSERFGNNDSLIAKLKEIKYYD